MPGADPGEGYQATNEQLYGSAGAPQAGTVPPMSGFVTNYAGAIKDNLAKGWHVVPGTTEQMIMGCFTPQTLHRGNPVSISPVSGYVCQRS